jgi:hypothetical protein
LDKQFEFLVTNLPIRLVKSKELVYRVGSASAKGSISSAQDFAGDLVCCDDFIFIDSVVHVGVSSDPICGNFGGSE